MLYMSPQAELVAHIWATKNNKGMFRNSKDQTIKLPPKLKNHSYETKFKHKQHFGTRSLPEI